MEKYTMEEVAKHNTINDCWVVVNNNVLNVTDFLKKHPGGMDAILSWAGKDASERYNIFHKPYTISKFAPKIIIGQLHTV